MKTEPFITVLLAIIFGCGSTAVAQQQPEQPLQELFQSETVYPQEKGAFQLTLASQFGNVSKKFSNDLTVEYGLTHAWQIDLQWELFAWKKAEDGLISRGSGDVRIGTKYSFMNMGGSNFHSAVGFELGLPAGNAKRGISEGQIEYEPYVIVAKDFPRLSRMQLFNQVGLRFARPVTQSTGPDDNKEGKAVEWNSGMFVLYRRSRFTTEITWTRGANESRLYFTPGIIWKLPWDLEFGVGVPLGLSRDADSFRMVVKTVYEFGGPRDHRKE